MQQLAAVMVILEVHPLQVREVHRLQVREVHPHQVREVHPHQVQEEHLVVEDHLVVEVRLGPEARQRDIEVLMVLQVQQVLEQAFLELNFSKGLETHMVH